MKERKGALTCQWGRISQSKDLHEDVLQNLEHSVKGESAHEAGAEINRHGCLLPQIGREFTARVFLKCLKFLGKEDG